MRTFYIISDTHDDREATERAVDFASSRGLENSAIVHAGDLALRQYCRMDLERLLRSGEINEFMEAVDRRFSNVYRGYREVLESSGMPHFVIPGNYDAPLNRFFKGVNIHNKAVNFNGIKIAGYGGGGNLDDEWIGPEHMYAVVKAGKIQLFNPREMMSVLDESNPKIAVIHNPPHGLCDDMFDGRHAGSLSLRRYLGFPRDLAVVICGHIHEAGPNGNNPNGIRGINSIKREDGREVVVINPGNLGRFGILDPLTLEPMRMFDYGTFVELSVEDDGTPARLVQYSVKDNGRIGKVRKLDVINF